ncbi:putative DNA-binding protein [Bacillus sp. TS-2]|nr:putative DNA-binding protein [Bacillus sp. TS-2]
MRSKSLLTKLILFGCLISIIPVLFLGIFSNSQASKQIQEKVNQEKVQMIEQINLNVEQVLKTVYFMFNHTVDSNIMDTAINSPLHGEDFIIHRNLKQELSQLQTYETMVNEFIVINLKENWLLSNTRLSRLDEHPDSQTYLSYMDQEHNSSWVLMDNSDFAPTVTNKGCSHTISLVHKLPTKFSEKYGMAFANIPACSLAKMININSLSDEILIVDEQERIMVHRDDSLIGQPLASIGSVEGELAFPERRGQYDLLLDGEEHSVTYITSDFNNWTYMSINSIEKLTQESKSIGWMTALVTTIIILVCLIIIWLMTNRIYSPIGRIMKEIEYRLPNQFDHKMNDLQLIGEQIHQLFSSNSNLKHELKGHKQQIQTLFMLRLIKGFISQKEIKSRLEYFQLSEQVNSWKKKTILTLQIDTMLDEDILDETEFETISFAVKNVTEETIGEEYCLPSIWFDQTLVIVIGHTTNEQKKIISQVHELTDQIQKNLERTLNISVSIGISLPFEELKKSNRAYKEGLEALKHRIKLGKCVIIPFSSINSGKHSIVFDYPQRTQAELLVAIKIADLDRSVELFDLWLSKVFKNTQSPREYQISMMRLLNNLLMVKQEEGISFQQIEVYHESLYEELLSLQTQDEIKSWFKERLIAPLVNVFKDRRESQFQNLSEQIIDLIHKNYDKEITLEECAAKLHYNANYLSSVFKQETNYTFSEYLTMHRFKLAKKWLIETDMTVKEIADKLQYKNSQNFIRSFKKHEEMTPGQYRQKYKKVS